MGWQATTSLSAIQLLSMYVCMYAMWSEGILTVARIRSNFIQAIFISQSVTFYQINTNDKQIQHQQWADLLRRHTTYTQCPEKRRYFMFDYNSRISWSLLQRGRIACNAERCISHGNSICPSVTRGYPIQTNEDRIMQSSLWRSRNTLVFWYQQWLGSDVPFHMKFALKLTHHPPMKSADFNQYLLIMTQP